MKKILFLPLLQMPSGHHQVADALIRSLEKRTTGIEYKKIDLLSEVSVLLEKLITGTYLKWINHLPKTYAGVYRVFAFRSNHLEHNPFDMFHHLFLNQMLNMLDREQPDLIICTHAYPSFLISRLKQDGKITTPVVNVYTDFLINNIWGREGIDAHFVPDAPFKDELSSKEGIDLKRILVTGIPIDESFEISDKKKQHNSNYNILISGGSNGLGSLEKLLKGIRNNSRHRYWVLCGNNEKLYKEICSWGMENIKPLPYIASRESMNSLYDQVDAIITKPGGITISEVLHKKLPLFVHSVLPGQEEINWRYLASRRLAYKLNSDSPVEKQIINVLESELEQKYYQKQIEEYHQHIEQPAWQKLLEWIEQNNVNSPNGGEIKWIN